MALWIHYGYNITCYQNTLKKDDFDTTKFKNFIEDQSLHTTLMEKRDL